ncbi:MAG: hypothetical protein ABL901_17970 [Hyphomicrobiaceae bacterium]
MKSNALVLAALVLFAHCSRTIPALAEAALVGDETPYDLGYASRASETCPNVELLVKPDAAKLANEDFKKGAAMFSHYLDKLKAEGACRAALNLYDSKAGKAARILRVK